MSKPLRICQLAAEFAPLAKVGGLGDVLTALSRTLHEQGHDVRPFLPFYSGIDTRELELTPQEQVRDVPIALGARELRFSLVRARSARVPLTVHLIDCPALYRRARIYTDDADEHLRFLLFTRAVIESCRRMGFEPDIFHCHDWHTAFTPLYLRGGGAKTVLTIHNIGYQGILPAQVLNDLGLPAGLLDSADLAQGRINALKHGIQHADMVTTVSPTYAREICTPGYGMGLDETLRRRARPPVGILNGIDVDEWNPQTDRYLKYHYSLRNFEGKRKTKAALLRQLPLKPAPSAPLIGIVSRMVRQKGFELLFEPMPRFLSERDIRLAVLGSGDAAYEEFFASLQQRFPAKVAYRRGHSEELAHLIEAASDMFLMPSLYEPCGLNQMYSLRYGTVPIVHRTGGLADTVQHFDPKTGEGNGVVFNDYDSPAVSWALQTALDWYADKRLWKRLKVNGMKQDFSWERQAARYVALYRSLI